MWQYLLPVYLHCLLTPAFEIRSFPCTVPCAFLLNALEDLIISPVTEECADTSIRDSLYVKVTAPHMHTSSEFKSGTGYGCASVRNMKDKDQWQIQGMGQ